YLAEHHIIGLEGIDTRSLVRRLRVRGAMRGVLSTIDLDDVSLVNKARGCPSIVGRDLAKVVMPAKAFPWSEGFHSPFITQELHKSKQPHRVVALDFGMKL